MGSIIFIGLIAVSILLLKGFDQIAGRGSKQIKDGINSSKLPKTDDRKPCPECAEMIKSEAKKCRFCNAEIQT